MIKGVLGRFFYALCDDAYINKKPLAITKGFLNMAPQPGLEPGTHGLTVRCSTD